MPEQAELGDILVDHFVALRRALLQAGHGRVVAGRAVAVGDPVTAWLPEHCVCRIRTLHQCSRHSTETVTGAVTGTVSAQTTALLGRFDTNGQLRFAGRTTVF
ncbi:hypothetical protein [Streptomyces sp. NPDC088246]|uniref:hypothetical protein n=1 Tax=Streptomyces sp. NPDC088246 TaxID=3365842 RepID=UPI00380E0C76